MLRGHVGPRSLRGQRLFPFVPWSRFAFGCVVRFGQPFSAAAPVIPPPVGSVFPFGRLRSHAPNNALQRTEAGGRLFLAFHVLRRQPPSLSLSSLGGSPSLLRDVQQPLFTPQSLFWSPKNTFSRHRVFSGRPKTLFYVAESFPAARKHSFASQSLFRSPENTLLRRRVFSDRLSTGSHRLTTRSSERRLAVGLSLSVSPCVASLRR